ncbi:HMG box-containing protein [Arthroderma uncinatum]|uniref:HMG box-containing protein n=1 Tax=Arthroderma uncinatum TaxID=74035 RepID=UPI00144ADE47|nr:HMG box-containing protein [Arthroderma uncinatum]KAF3490558.1 HMG box-containing protein [Arthroderma uncinatum]
MARLYIAKPNDARKTARKSPEDKDKEDVKEKTARSRGVAIGKDMKNEPPSTNTHDPAEGHRKEENTKQTITAEKHKNDQGTLISQFTDLSLTFKKREKGRKAQQPGASSQVCRLAQSTEENEEEISQTDAENGIDDEKEVVRRFTQLQLQGGSDEEREKEPGRSTPDKADIAIQQDRKKRPTHILEPSRKESSDSEDQQEDRIAGQSDNDESDGFDSLDDFIVSDNESLSLYEGTESEGDDDYDSGEENIISDKKHPTSDTEPEQEQEQEPEPEPEHRPRRRLIRGRRGLRPSIPQHTLDDENCEANIAGSPLSFTAKPLFSTGVGSNTGCITDQEQTGQNADIKTNLLSDSKPLLPPPTSSKTSKSHTQQDKMKPNLTPTKKTMSRAIDFTQGTSQPSPESPQERNSQMDFVTPPTSPSKPCLKSPSKSQKNRIPPSPHRPSIDTFWSQEAVNQWNDKFSPRKMQTPNFHRRHFDIFSDTEDDEEDEELQSPDNQDDDYGTADVSIPGHLGTPDPESASDKLPLFTSPIKNNSSPGKKQIKASTSTKKALAAKKREFDEQKHALAINFFNELDNIVTGGKILKLTKSAGGVNIVWNNKLATTAGRATWKKELITKTRQSTEQQVLDSSSANLCSPNTSSSHASSMVSPPNTNSLIRTKSSPSEKRSTSSRTIKHNATIELAEKVIDSEDRLLNTLAHEYCHLANFMISGVLNQPHGASFKQWAKECKTALDSNPKYSCRVEINTKHSYLINYKYMWCCETCGQEYGRHSRSIDPAKVRCGKCYDGVLLQVKPKPRGKGKNKET